MSIVDICVPLFVGLAWTNLSDICPVSPATTNNEMIRTDEGIWRDKVKYPLYRPHYDWNPKGAFKTNVHFKARDSSPSLSSFPHPSNWFDDGVRNAPHLAQEKSPLSDTLVTRLYFLSYPLLSRRALVLVSPPWPMGPIFCHGHVVAPSKGVLESNLVTSN